MKNANSHSHDKLQRMTGLSIFTAVIVVLTVLCTFVRFGPFSITLALAPIVIGAALYGPGAGAYLGGVFGLVVLLTGVFGWDGGTVMYLMSLNAVGCILICIGKGNEDWNYSAPHGAGRVMGRKEAHYKLKMEDFEDSMKNVWSSTVCKDTIDEAPMAYKDMSEIVANIEPTAEIVNIIKPIFNFKAAE